MEFSRPEYWSTYAFPSPGDLPNPGIEARSLALQADSLPLSLQEAHVCSWWLVIAFIDYLLYTAAAAAAKPLQWCPTLCDHIDGSPPGSPIPGILQARTLEWVAISFSNA